MRTLRTILLLCIGAASACTTHKTFPTGCRALANEAGDFACVLPASATDVSLTRDRLNGHVWLRFRGADTFGEVRRNAHLLGFASSAGDKSDLSTVFIKDLGAEWDKLSPELEFHERVTESGSRSWLALDPATGWVFVYGVPR